jgi:L-threonylcarbamoyladenylate synthase
MSIITSDINQAQRLLNEGHLVAIPTETVYGLAGNALNPLAVSKIFEAKRRPFFDPLIVHIANENQLKLCVDEIPDKANLLMEKFWPGPLTLLFQKSNLIPDIVTSGLPKVAVRMPNHALTLSLLNGLEFPLAAPSANPFGYISPTCAEHVAKNLGDVILMVLDGGNCAVGLESTIVDASETPVKILRLGGVSVEEIEKCLGEAVLVQKSSSQPQAPGMLDSHYAPRKPMYWFNESIHALSSSRIGYLSFNHDLIGDIVFELSKKGDLVEAAAHLFQGMRWLDDQDVDCIVVKPFPDEGIGKAINDRLSRACQS